MEDFNAGQGGEQRRGYFNPWDNTGCRREGAQANVGTVPARIPALTPSIHLYRVDAGGESRRPSRTLRNKGLLSLQPAADSVTGSVSRRRKFM